MSEDELNQCRNWKYRRSRIPVLDALSTFVPDASPDDPVVQQAIDRVGFSRWYPTEGGHRVLILYEGGPYDATRFTIETAAWDHEHCKLCRVLIPAMTLCWVTEGGPYIILCQECHTKVAGPAGA